MQCVERNPCRPIKRRVLGRRVPVVTVSCRLKFMSAQITAIEGLVDDEIDSNPTLREKVEL